MKRFPTLSEHGAQLTCEDAIGLAAIRFGITAKAIRNTEDRRHVTTQARAFAMYEARRKGATPAQIKRAMGIPHQTTVEVALREEAGRRVEFRSIRGPK